MKSTLFVLLFQLYGQPDYVRPMAVYSDITQCRAAVIVHESDNKAASYRCEPADVAGTWTRKAQAYLVRQ